MKKTRIPTRRRKLRIIRTIIDAVAGSESFLLVGHQHPDEDCISSMVAFSLLLGKLNKRCAIVLPNDEFGNFGYLLDICKYNSITILHAEDQVEDAWDYVVVMDTPKPSMMEFGPTVTSLAAFREGRVVEFDHHLEADGAYIGVPALSFVDEASSTCELVGYFALRLRARRALLREYGQPDLMSRNFVLSVMTGIVSDTKMGRFLKSKRERRYYRYFSSQFDAMLARKTMKGSGNLSSLGDIFLELEKLSEEEHDCCQYMESRKKSTGHVAYVALGAEDCDDLFQRFGADVVITVARYIADQLAEESGCLSMVAYYDHPDASDLIQFRMRRSMKYKRLDLRRVVERLGIENGGGHEGAVGFRVPRDRVADFEGLVAEVLAGTEDLVSGA